MALCNAREFDGGDADSVTTQGSRSSVPPVAPTEMTPFDIPAHLLNGTGALNAQTLLQVMQTLDTLTAPVSLLLPSVQHYTLASNSLLTAYLLRRRNRLPARGRVGNSYGKLPEGFDTTTRRSFEEHGLPKSRNIGTSDPFRRSYDLAMRQYWSHLSSSQRDMDDFEEPPTPQIHDTLLLYNAQLQHTAASLQEYGRQLHSNLRLGLTNNSVADISAQ